MPHLRINGGEGVAIGCCPTFDCPGGVMLTATGITEAWVMGVRV